MRNLLETGALCHKPVGIRRGGRIRHETSAGSDRTSSGTFWGIVGCFVKVRSFQNGKTALFIFNQAFCGLSEDGG